MVEVSSPTIAVDGKTHAGVSLLGAIAATATAYYTGQTGNWEPLMAVSLGLLFIVLFVTSE